MTRASGSGRSELLLRVVSGVVLAGLAVLTAWLGDVLFLLFWGAAAVAVLVEWWRLVGGEPGWRFPGLLYAFCAVGPAVVLRFDPQLGLAVIAWLFAVVWGSDIFAYFTGRTLGGPKLWPSVSPNKTWSGFLGGTLAAILLGLGVAHWAGVERLWPVALVSLVAAVASQGGDLFESSLKRRFGVKDSGAIIPGHGGVMDRLDGFIFAATAAAIVGVVHGGWSAAGQGVLVW